MVDVSPHRGHPGFAIVVVNYGSHKLLRANLEPASAESPGVTTIVVDNFSTETEREDVSRLCLEKGWLLLPRVNDGFGAAVNAGVAHAMSLGHSVFILVNPDLSADADALMALAAHAAERPDALTSPLIVRPDGRLWFAGGEVSLDDGRTRTKAGSDSSRPNGWVSGACLAVHRDLWSRVGGFDRDYFLYWEDVDLSWRCAAAGGQLMVRDDIVVTHSVGGTQQATGKSFLYYYYNCRNRILFARKNLDTATQRRWMRRSVSAARLIVLRGGKRQFLSRPWLPIWAAITGTVAGMRAAAHAQEPHPNPQTHRQAKETLGR